MLTEKKITNVFGVIKGFVDAGMIYKTVVVHYFILNHYENVTDILSILRSICFVLSFGPILEFSAQFPEKSNKALLVHS